tara:strand:+ start:10 stop:1068 length:1059 start_codon:yes stop_codon:yes gene_type:complete
MVVKGKIIDLFSGIGGFSLGFEEAGFKSILAVDSWSDAIQSYNLNRKHKVGTVKGIETFSNEDLKEIVKKEGKVDGIIGGPPCQGFSMVGTRKKGDDRNSLYLHFVRFVDQIKPNFFILENVKGLVSMSGGYFKRDIIERFSKLGYNVNYSILKASDYGLPQNRERVFFVGFLNKKYNDLYFEFPEKSNIRLGTKDALNDLPLLDHNPLNRKYRCLPENDFQRMMRENPVKDLKNHDITNHTEKTLEIISQVPDGGNIKDIDPKYYKVRNYNAAFKRMSSSKPSITIDCGHRNYFHFSENRVPTARESARIQTFPDDFEFYGSKTSQYTQIGNAVPPMLSHQIAKKIVDLCY